MCVAPGVPGGVYRVQQPAVHVAGQHIQAPGSQENLSGGARTPAFLRSLGIVEATPQLHRGRSTQGQARNLWKVCHADATTHSMQCRQRQTSRRSDKRKLR